MLFQGKKKGRCRRSHVGKVSEDGGFFFCFIWERGRERETETEKISIQDVAATAARQTPVQANPPHRILDATLLVPALEHPLRPPPSTRAHRTRRQRPSLIGSRIRRQHWRPTCSRLEAIRVSVLGKYCVERVPGSILCCI